MWESLTLAMRRMVGHDVLDGPPARPAADGRRGGRRGTRISRVSPGFPPCSKLREFAIDKPGVPAGLERPGARSLQNRRSVDAIHFMCFGRWMFNKRERGMKGTSERKRKNRDQIPDIKPDEESPTSSYRSHLLSRVSARMTVVVHVLAYTDSNAARVPQL